MSKKLLNTLLVSSALCAMASGAAYAGDFPVLFFNSKNDVPVTLYLYCSSGFHKITSGDVFSYQASGDVLTGQGSAFKCSTNGPLSFSLNETTPISPCPTLQSWVNDNNTTYQFVYDSTNNTCTETTGHYTGG